MALCNKCWRQVEPGATFCENCGAKVEMGGFREKRSSSKGIVVALIALVAIFLIATVAGFFAFNYFSNRELSDEKLLEVVRLEEIDSYIDEIDGYTFGQVFREIEDISRGEVKFNWYCNEDIPNFYFFKDGELEMDKNYYVGIKWNYYEMFKFMNIVEVDKKSKEITGVWDLEGGWEDGYTLTGKISADEFAENTYELISGHEAVLAINNY